MDRQRMTWDRDFWPIPLGFGILALLLRLWHLDADSIWLDEGFTAYHSSLPALQHWTQPVVNKPPLFYHLTALFWSPGDGAFQLRLPSALLGTATVVVAAFWGRALGGIRLAMLYAGLMTIASINLHYSQEARNYMALTLGWMLVGWALWQLLVVPASPSRPARGPLAGLGVGSFLLIHLHPIALFYLLAAGVAYLAALAQARRLTWPAVLYPAGVVLVIGLAILPWIRVMPTGFDWLRQPTAMEALSAAGKLASGGALAAWLSLLGGALFLRRCPPPQAVLLAGLAFLPPLFLWLAGFVKPVYMLRTLVPVHAFAVLGLALLIDSLAPGRRAWAVGCLVIGLVGYQTVRYYAQPGKENWQAVAAEWQRQGGQTSDLILLHKPEHYVPLHFYLPATELTAAVLQADGQGKLGLVEVGTRYAWGCAAPRCQPEPRSPVKLTPVIWVVKRGIRTPPDVEEIAAALGSIDATPYRAVSTFRDRSVWLVRLERADSPAPR